MPRRVEIRVGEVASVSGVLVTLAYTRGKAAGLIAAEFDDDGLSDAAPQLLTAAANWRRQFDRRSQTGKDGGNSHSV